MEGVNVAYSPLNQNDFDAMSTPYSLQSFSKTPSIHNSQTHSPNSHSNLNNQFDKLDSSATQRSTLRKVEYSKVNFEIHDEVKAIEFDEFIRDLETFEREEQCGWLRSTLPSATQLVFNTRYKLWSQAKAGENLLTMPTEKFIKLTKYIQHCYFSDTGDSEFVEPGQRIISALESKLTVLKPKSGVRALEMLAIRFEKAGILYTDLSTIHSTDLESVREAFKGCVVPSTQESNQRKFVQTVLGAGPLANQSQKIEKGVTLSMWLDDMTLPTSIPHTTYRL